MKWKGRKGLAYFYVRLSVTNPEQISLLSCRSDCSEKAWRGAARKTAAAVWNWLPAFSEKLSTFNSFHFYTDTEWRIQNISLFFCRDARQWPSKSVMQGQNIFVKSLADLLLWPCLYLFATVLFKFLVAFLDTWHFAFQWPNRQPQKWLQQWGWRSAPRSLLFEVFVQFSRLALRHSWQLVWVK